MTREKLKESDSVNRPYEKCYQLGPSYLTDAELLAVILRTGRQGASAMDVAEEVMTLSEKEHGLLGICHLSIPELMTIPGIGEVKAIQIQCIGELSRRIARSRAREKLSFKDPGSIAAYYMEDLRHKERETLIVMMLDSGNRLIGDKAMSVGTLNASLVSTREIFLEALRYHAAAVILVHNHPSGDAAPSPEDRAVTEKVRRAGKLLEIQLLDHIVIGDQCYTSFCEKGYL